jgi:hypothetical protein
MVCETRIDIADIDKHDPADLVCVDCLFIRSPVTIWCIRLGHGLVVQRVGGGATTTRILFSDCFPRSNADQVQDWESAVIKIVERIDERGTQVYHNNGSAARLPTDNSDFQQQHKRVVDALESELPGVYSARTFTNQDKDTLTARIKEHGNPTFSTIGLKRNEARKQIMDKYQSIKTDFVINTVREFSQNDRVAIATYLILNWYMNRA